MKKKKLTEQPPGTVRQFDKDGNLVWEKPICEVYDVKPTGIPGLGYYTIGERDEITPEKKAEWVENFKAIQNQLIADGAHPYAIDMTGKPNAADNIRPHHLKLPKLEPPQGPKELYAIMVTNRWTKSKYLYPVIYEKGEAEKAMESIPQSNGPNNILEIIKISHP